MDETRAIFFKKKIARVNLRPPPRVFLKKNKARVSLSAHASAILYEEAPVLFFKKL